MCTEPWAQSSALYKPSMLVYCYDPSTTEQGRKRDQKWEIALGYKASLRPAWAISNPVSKKASKQHSLSVSHVCMRVYVGGVRLFKAAILHPTCRTTPIREQLWKLRKRKLLWGSRSLTIPLGLCTGRSHDAVKTVRNPLGTVQTIGGSARNIKHPSHFCQQLRKTSPGKVVHTFDPSFQGKQSHVDLWLQD